MNRSERAVIASVLVLISILVGVDIATDFREGALLWHLLAEGSVGVAALFGVFYLFRGSVVLRHRLEKEMQDFIEFKARADVWRRESKKYLDGLSLAIDQQLSRWGLSPAEKEVAFLLLKGLSSKEIAEVRNTSEKTVRVQSAAIYSKAGLSGRSELAAFFLEDLLLPHETLS